MPTNSYTGPRLNGLYKLEPKAKVWISDTTRNMPSGIAQKNQLGFMQINHTDSFTLMISLICVFWTINEFHNQSLLP